MDPDFWHQRWNTGQIGFHNDSVNRMLTEHVGHLPGGADARVFLPLCGKTRDIAWLLDQGFDLVGVELSTVAVEELFAEMDVTPEVSKAGPFRRFAAQGVEIFAGDFFDLDAARIGPVTAVYDRAALVALPADMRRRYAAHIVKITGAATQLLVTLEYDQQELNGPPFSVDAAEVRSHYAAGFAISCLTDEEVPGGIKGRIPGRQAAWLLSPR